MPHRLSLKYMKSVAKSNRRGGYVDKRHTYLPTFDVHAFLCEEFGSELLPSSFLMDAVCLRIQWGESSGTLFGY
jgi:hypothetical protein